MNLLVCSKCQSLYETEMDTTVTVACRVRHCRHALVPVHKDARIAWVRHIVDSHEE